MSANESGFVVYIDEAGDPGIKSKKPVDRVSEWFVVSAVVVSKANDPDVVDWVRDMREAVRAQQRTPLHYRNLSLSNRQRVARMLATKRARLFVVASHKTNMRGRQNPRMGKPQGRGEFYNWCLRLLLERVSEWCDHRAKVDESSNRTMKLVFSERGGHDYGHLAAYLKTLEMQALAGGAFLKAKQIIPGTINHTAFTVRPHDKRAGLQLADIVASAFFQALNVEDDPEVLQAAKNLRARVGRSHKASSAAGFGVAAFPLPHQGKIPEISRAILEYYGYVFEK